MEQAIPAIKVQIQMGHQINANFLAQGEFWIATRSQEVQQLRNKINFKPQIQGKFLLQIMFNCQIGRQEECVHYIQKGLNIKHQGINEESLSPIQKLLSSPRNQSNKFQISSSSGKVILFYDFAQKYIDQWNEGLQVFQNHECNLNFHTKLSLRGQQSHNNENRTTVKVDYCHYNFLSQNIYAKQFMNASISLNGDPSIEGFPAYTMLGNVKKIHLNIKTQPYRQILNYFQRASDQGKATQHEDKNFPYVPPGLFREKATATLFFCDKMAMHLEIAYQSQQVFLRLTKVYMNLVQKVFSSGDD